jgi:hypothetical protein
VSSCLCNGLLISHSPFTSAGPTAIERWLTSPRVAHDGMWIYIDPSTAYLDARIGEQFDGIIFIRDITPIHPTENALRTSRAHRGLLAWTPHHSRQHAVGSDLASFGPVVLAKFALHCLAQRPPPGVRGLKLQRLPARLARTPRSRQSE